MRESKYILLESKQYAIEKRWLSWWHLWSTLAVWATVTVPCFFDISLWIRVPCSLIAGLTLVRVFILYHDYQHGTILRGSWISKAIMTFYGLVVLNPASIWNRSHDHHHQNNAKIYGASIGSYPVMTCESYAQASFGERLLYHVSRSGVTIALGYFTIFFYGMCLRSLFVSPKRHFDSAVAIGLHIVLLAGLAWISPWVMILVLVLPMTVAGGLGAYLFYAQHNYPTVMLQDRAKWDYLFAALHSSSFIKMNPVMHWFTGNIGYHHVHHLNARIPFYRLPETMAAIPELQSPGTTSLSIIDVYRCLRLKLWDTERDRLIPLKAQRLQSAGGDV
jgi:omega-6 fatty acid desaturase (delta-12 desaturase)